jgi:hypothetical protein
LGQGSEGKWFSNWKCDISVSSGSPSEQQLWEALKRARTATQVRKICSMSKALGRASLLYERAEQFLAARSDSRYPRKASTKDDQRLLYCARAMAAISLRLSPATAVDRLRKLKHRNCDCSHCALVASLKMKASIKEKVKKL